MCSMRQVRDRHGDRKLITDHVKDSVKAVLIFYYVGNIVLDISGISTKVSHDNTWRSHFCSSGSELLPERGAAPANTLKLSVSG